MAREPPKGRGQPMGGGHASGGGQDRGGHGGGRVDVALIAAGRHAHGRASLMERISGLV